MLLQSQFLLFLFSGLCISSISCLENVLFSLYVCKIVASLYSYLTFQCQVASFYPTCAFICYCIALLFCLILLYAQVKAKILDKYNIVYILHNLLLCTTYQILCVCVSTTVGICDLICDQIHVTRMSIFFHRYLHLYHCLSFQSSLLIQPGLHVYSWLITESHLKHVQLSTVDQHVMEEVLRGHTFLLPECTESIEEMALRHNE